MVISNFTISKHNQGENKNDCFEAIRYSNKTSIMEVSNISSSTRLCSPTVMNIIILSSYMKHIFNITPRISSNCETILCQTYKLDKT